VSDIVEGLDLDRRGGRKAAGDSRLREARINHNRALVAALEVPSEFLQ